jgi:hypothetical protein
MTKERVSVIAKDAESALKAKFDGRAIVTRGSGRFSDTEVTIKFTFTLPKNAGDTANAEREMFERMSTLFGFTPEHYKATFKMRTKTFELIGFDPRKPKFAVKVRDQNGKIFGVSVETAKLATIKK